MPRFGSLFLSLALITSLSAPALAKTEKEFISDAIKGDNSEVAMGRLALSNGMSEPVKAFGQMLIDDHSKAKTDASAVATQLGISPPANMSAEAQREVEKLRRLSGRDFDKEFIRVMVRDHEKDVAEFKKEAASGQGSVQQLAAQTAPTLEKHLQTAHSLSGAK